MVMESRNAQRAVDPHSPDLKNAAFFKKIPNSLRTLFLVRSSQRAVD